MTATRRTIAHWSSAAAVLFAASLTQAADYEVDPSHSFVEFRVQHLGYSWLYGRFNTVSGQFSHDPSKPQASSINVAIDAASIDTNHAERDKHLRGEDFLTVSKFGKAAFKSTRYTGSAEEGTLEGELTLMGITRPIAIKVKKLGEGKDPWGGYRAGFIGSYTLDRRDFKNEYNLGPKGWQVHLDLGIEGIRK